MKRSLAVPFYLVCLGSSIAASYWLAPLMFLYASPATVGVILSAVFAALYLGELKQESIGQLYQALASSSLKSAEQAAFNEKALAKITAIRRIFLQSNILKLLGTAAGLYLLNEKQTPIPVPSVEVARFALGMLFFSILLFARLWCEVSSAERLLIAVKLATMLQDRRKAFLDESATSSSHDFENDDVARSFSNPPRDGLNPLK
jgi:hypothetical protein